MPNTVSTYLKYANLQMAAESLFGVAPVDAPGTTKFAGSMTSESLTTGNLRSSRFTAKQAEQFLNDGWTVVEHKSNTATGFSGTLFKKQTTNELVLSFRSTEFVDDAARDNQATNNLEVLAGGWAFGQIADMEDWYAEMNQRVDRLAGQNFSVTGYSLGGHLATAFNLLRREEGQAGRINATYTFNGAGVGAVKTGTLTQALDVFRAGRNSGNTDLFTDPTVRSLYLDIRGGFDVPAPTRVQLLAAISRVVDPQLVNGGNASNFARVTQLNVLLQGLRRSLQVHDEAQRVVGLTNPVNELGAGGPRDVPVASIAAVGLDYQIAVLRAQQRTASVNTTTSVFGRTPALDLTGLSPFFDVYGAVPPSAVANSQLHYGTPTPIYIEDQPLWRGDILLSATAESAAYVDVKLLVNNFSRNDFGDTHSLVLLVDSLSVQSAIARLAPGVQLGTLNAIFAAASNITAGSGIGTDLQGRAEGDVLENVLDGLRRIILERVAPDDRTDGNTAGGSWAKVVDAEGYEGRNTFHQRLAELTASTAFIELVGKVTATASSGRALQASARKDFAAFLTLHTLSPVALSASTGNEAAVAAALAGPWTSVHGDWQADKDLTAAQREQGLGIYTDAYLRDRAAMLDALVARNARNAEVAPLLFGPNTLYEDMASQTTVRVGGALQDSHRPQVWFGDAEANARDGGGQSDRLYGGAGHDTLSGQGGSDRLEGNAGNDRLVGGAGNDTLVGGAGNDTYVLDVDGGDDLIIDADHEGSIRIGQQQLDGGDYVSANRWERGGVIYSYAPGSNGRGTLSIRSTAGTTTVRDYALGELGLTLPGAQAPAPAPAPSNIVVGDLAPVDFDLKEAGVQVRYDALGNVITQADAAEPDRVDRLFGSQTGDLLRGQGGNDLLTGRDGDDTLEGGVGADVLSGETGSDELHADGAAEADDAIAGGASGAGSGLRGDHLSGGEGDDLLIGDSGNDALFGGTSADTLIGGLGDDHIDGDGHWVALSTTWSITRHHEFEEIPSAFGPPIELDVGRVEFSGMTTVAQAPGEDATDIIEGGAGDDWISGGEGDDYIDGGEDDDDIQGGAGGDFIAGGDGDDGVNGDGFDAPGRGGHLPGAEHGDDVIFGGAGHDDLWGNGGDDQVYGEVGNDVLGGDDPLTPGTFHGADVLDGGSGNDWLAGHGGDDTLFGGAGDDEIQGDGSQVDTAVHGNDELDGGDGADAMFGGGGNDTVLGGDGEDILHGNNDDDLLHGGAKYDNLYGDAGNDTLIGGTGTDHLDGGAGNDVYVLDAGEAPVDADGSMESIFDGSGTNTVRFGAGVSKAGLVARMTDDGGFLRIDYTGSDHVLVKPGAVQSYQFADGTQLSATQLIGRYSPQASSWTDEAGLRYEVGGTGGDALVVLTGRATFAGGRGDDSLSGAGGGNTYLYERGDGRDTIADAAGVDSRTGQAHATSRIVFGPGVLPSDIRLGHDGGALLLSVLGAPGDTLRLAGFSADDAQAPLNIDSFEFADGTRLTYAELMVRGFDIVGGDAADDLRGTNIDDRLDGGGGDDTLRGGRGSDTYIWGVGTDLIDDADSAQAATDRLIVQPGVAPTDLVLTRAGDDLLVRRRDGSGAITVRNHFVGAGVERFVFADGTNWDAAAIVANVTYGLTDFADNHTGSPGSDVIDALGGNDTVRGSNGDDRIDGGSGDDSLYGDMGADALSGGDGTDYLVGGSGNDSLRGNAGADSLMGGEGSDVLDGGSGNDSLYGDDGADVYLFGRGSGVDTIMESASLGLIDTLRLDLGLTAADLVVTGDGASLRLGIVGTNDSVTIAGPEASSSTKIERIEFGDGTAWEEADWIERLVSAGDTSGNDVIRGFEATGDVLRSRAGQDTLYGLGGNDTLHDGVVMYGGAGNDSYRLTTWPQGQVTLHEAASGGANADELVLPVASGAIELRRTFNEANFNFDDLTLRNLGSPGTIVVPLYFMEQFGGAKIETIRFADGVTYSAADVLRNVTQAPSELGDFVLNGFRWADTIDGLGGTDYIYGNGGDDLLLGSDGADVMDGEEGNDTVYGGADADYLVRGGWGNDYVDGGDGADTLVGDLYSDGTVSARDGHDTLRGGRGDDALAGNGGNDTYLIDRSDGDDRIDERAGSDRLLFAPGILPGDVSLFRDGLDLVIAMDGGGVQTRVSSHFADAANQIELLEFADGSVWDAGDIQARTVAGAPDAMAGTSGDDSFVVDSAGDSIAEGVDQGIDSVISSISWTLGDNLENLTLTGYLNLSATGNSLANVIAGNAGRNALLGGLGLDTLVGGAGDDTYYVWSEADVVVEAAGEGIDTVITSGAYVLPDHVENLTASSSFPYRYAASLTGNASDNVLTIDSSRDGSILNGGAGADTMIGGAYGVTFHVDNPGDVILGGGTVVSAIDWTLGPLMGYSNLTLTGAALHGIGNDYNNVLTSDGQGRVLEGMGGDDTYHIVYGGPGVDTVIEQADGGSDLVWVGGAQRTYAVEDFSNVESLGLETDAGESSLVGDGGANRLYGNEYNNSLVGGGGDDYLFADVLPRHLGGDYSGTDTLSGGAGNDTLVGSAFDLYDGGAGDDLIDASRPGGKYYGSAATVRFGHGYGADRISGGSVSVRFNADVEMDDVQVLRNGRDLTFSLGASDALTISHYFPDSILPRDIVMGVHFADGTWLDGSILTQRMLSGNSNQTTDGNDLWFGSSAANSFDGQGGNDTLMGFGGADAMRGGAGDDRLIGAGGADTLCGDDGADTLVGGEGSDDLAGGVGDDIIVSGMSADTVRFARGDGRDLIMLFENESPDREVDTLSFGAGITPADVSLTRSGYDLAISVAGGNDQITVHDYLWYGSLLVLTFADGTTWDAQTVYDAASTIQGTSGNDNLAGSEVSDRLLGLAGNDTLFGDYGNDRLDGGVGSDVMQGGYDDDSYWVDAVGDVVTEVSNQGYDTVYTTISYTLPGNVDALQLLGTASINATGNSLANTMYGNSGSNVLNGGSGSDYTAGGPGDDTYVVASSGDVVVEAVAEGADTVQSSITYSLGENVEHLRLTGSSTINGTGNALSNRLTGNSANNFLTGGAGDDTIDGGSGADSMSGGTGNDNYLVNVSSDVVTEAIDAGIDTVSSSVSWALGSYVEHLILSGSGANSATGNALDNQLTGNTANNTLTGGAGHDTLDGGAGTDSMLGGAGNDIYFVNVSTDVVTENANEGIDTVHSAVTRTLGNNQENLTLTGSSAINGTGNSLDNVLTGNSAANVLNGAAGDDVYVGGLGNDTLTDSSTTSADIYRWGIGQGNDSISDAGGSDRIEILPGVDSSQVTLIRSGNNLQVGIAGATDVLTVLNWYTSSANRIEEIRLSDGSVIGASVSPQSVAGGVASTPAARSGPARDDAASGADLSPSPTSWMLASETRQLLEAMAQFDPPAGGWPIGDADRSMTRLPVLLANAI